MALDDKKKHMYRISDHTVLSGGGTLHRVNALHVPFRGTELAPFALRGDPVTIALQ